MLKSKLTALTLLLFLLTITSVSIATTNLTVLSDEEFLTQVKIYQSEIEELDQILSELHRRFPEADDRLKAIATIYLGADYYTEPFTDEIAEWMPYKKTNCTMFVLYATAFLNGDSYNGALEHMRLLHYKNGEIGFKTRYHFTTDRITNPENIYFTEVTEQYIKDPAFLQEVTVTLNKKSDGNLLFGDRLDDWTKELTVKYIPRIGFDPELLKELPPSLGIAFVKRSNWRIGVIVGHEGILIDGDLYHSGSPSTGLYVQRDYLNTYFPRSDWEGVIFFTLNQVN